MGISRFQTVDTVVLEWCRLLCSHGGLSSNFLKGFLNLVEYDLLGKFMGKYFGRPTI